MSTVWAPVVFTSMHDPQTVSRAAKRGGLLRLTQGVYTSLIDELPEDVVAAHLWSILNHVMPGAVLVDRSAHAAQPVDGVLVVDYSRRTRALELPGLTVYPRRGPGPVAGDMPFMDGLYLSSTARQLLDNLDRSRGHDRRTLTDIDVEDWLDDLLAERGPDGINRLRDQARELAPALSRGSALRRLEALIKASLGTGEARAVSSTRLAARTSGHPYDPRRHDAFQRLAAHLLEQAPDVLAAVDRDEPRRRLLPFYEAYFSNFIEGTEFTLDEAADIVFSSHVPLERPQDAHDVLATYEIVNDPVQMSRTARDVEQFLELLTARHARTMAARPAHRPGTFKNRANRAGSTEFVRPELVEGTLRRGFETGAALISPFSRAVYMMFLVTEVHPFSDGNGRVARIMMNAELASAHEVRILIPIVYRANYLSALKAATHSANFSALQAMLAFARRYTAQIDFSTRQSAERDLERTNALRESHEADRAGLHLQLPSSR